MNQATLVIVTVLWLAIPGGADKKGCEVVMSWKQLNFTWRTGEEYRAWERERGAQNCLLAGIKVDTGGNIFVSVPRWKPNVPATLSRVDRSTGLLEPYPSWEMNEPGVEGLNSVLGFEIDPEDRMWIVDQGKVNGKAAARGTIKLVVWDLRKNESVLVHRFTEEEAPLDVSFLNDIVVDVRNGFAFITDSGLPVNTSDGSTYGGLIVFDARRRVSRRVLGLDPSVLHDPTLWIEINGRKVRPGEPMRTGADGIALTADAEKLYWCPLTSHSIFALNGSLLRDFGTSQQKLSRSVERVVRDRGSASDGLACDNAGSLLMTSLEGNAILVGKLPSLAMIGSLAHDDQALHWPDTIGFDHKGAVVWVTNELHRFDSGTIDWGDVNFRIWRAVTGTDSYMADPF